MPKKEGAWTVCRFKGGAWQERGGGVFEGGGVDTLMPTMMQSSWMILVINFTYPVTTGSGIMFCSN